MFQRSGSHGWNIYAGSREMSGRGLRIVVREKERGWAGRCLVGLGKDWIKTEYEFPIGIRWARDSARPSCGALNQPEWKIRSLWNGRHPIYNRR